MAFAPPTFNLVVNIWRYNQNVGTPPAVITAGNLSPGKRVVMNYGLPLLPFNAAHIYPVPPPMELLLPKGTDVRRLVPAVSGSDVVEVPAGSGRYYVVTGVDDVGKGFPNEYRLATVVVALAGIQQLWNSAATGAPDWPEPYP